MLPLESNSTQGLQRGKKPTPQGKYFVWDSFLTDQGKALIATPYYEATMSLITRLGVLGVSEQSKRRRLQKVSYRGIGGIVLHIKSAFRFDDVCLHVSKLQAGVSPRIWAHLCVFGTKCYFFAFDFTIFLISNVFTQSEQCAVSLLLFKEESLGRGIIRSVLKTS